MSNQLTVEPIEEGTVIDHIEGGKGRKVLELLGVGPDFSEKVALVMNVPSKKLGKKDIVKIAGVSVSAQQANLIALVSPHATINIIKGSTVAQKYAVRLPPILEGVGVCPNPNCITTVENAVQRFRQEGNLYRCHYCERLFRTHELVQ